jgi:DNA repair exonuclease SbcCD ATPase subunit
VLRETPVPEPRVSRQDLGRLKADLEARNRELLDTAEERVKALKLRHQELQGNLEKIQNSMRDDLAKQQARQAYEQEQALQRVERLKKMQAGLDQIDSLGQSLEKTRSVQQLHTDSIGELNDTVQALHKSLSLELEEVRDFRKAFTAKSERLEGVIDLMNAMRKDINDNSRGLVDLQNELDKSKRPAKTIVSSGWFGKLSRWQYLPVAAAGLSAVALALAASQ